MFQDDRLEIADSLAETDIESDAVKYARKVVDGDYEFNCFAESKGYNSDVEKVNLANSYETLLTHESQPFTEAEDYIPLVGAELQFDDDIFVNSFKILEKARKNNIFNSGKPQSFAAGIVYTGVLLEQERKGRISTQDEIAEAAEVSARSLTSNFREIFHQYDQGNIEFDWL